ncbi:hypothetical protein [Oceanicaulis sp.]|uniref:hypothetical protein n=1 Tax=Oceanicaulis sp. TaxID=1924941 RepID=UPI003BAA1489
MLWVFLGILTLLDGASNTAEPLQVSETELATAWASGDVREARSVFEAAFNAASQGPCPISPYSAELAYRTGLLMRSGYHFNMALKIDDQVDSLSDTQREVAQSMRSEPGEYQHEDRQFLFSPYTARPADLAVCRDVPFPELPTALAGQGDRAVFYMRSHWERLVVQRELSGRTVSDLELTDVVVLDGYPLSEGPELASRLTGLRMYGEDGGWIVEHYSFSPCHNFSYRRHLQTVCRPGFEGEVLRQD